ncbi:hypothetical protein PROFUN_06310 [Planoprotostelium fungivorum]|uniref:Uncharacterized protein n=1 Tax=Planoprotostelium fungivorum TaxID=1890364 RepID=A0A2P6NP47_9EUKA|nr:hypothetical protein PROFUN_06310 [Planoprotostelium fungivorum]
MVSVRKSEQVQLNEVTTFQEVDTVTLAEGHILSSVSPQLDETWKYLDGITTLSLWGSQHRPMTAAARNTHTTVHGTTSPQTKPATTATQLTIVKEEKNHSNLIEQHSLTFDPILVRPSLDHKKQPNTKTHKTWAPCRFERCFFEVSYFDSILRFATRFPTPVPQQKTGLDSPVRVLSEMLNKKERISSWDRLVAEWKKSHILYEKLFAAIKNQINNLDEKDRNRQMRVTIGKKAFATARKHAKNIAPEGLCSDVRGASKGDKIGKDVFTFVSEDLKHDAHFIISAWEEIQKSDIFLSLGVTRINFWNDNCRGQFRNFQLLSYPLPAACDGEKFCSQDSIDVSLGRDLNAVSLNEAKRISSLSRGMNAYLAQSGAKKPRKIITCDCGAVANVKFKVTACANCCILRSASCSLTAHHRQRIFLAINPNDPTGSLYHRPKS